MLHISVPASSQRVLGPILKFSSAMKPICALLFVVGVCRGSVIPLEAQGVIASGISASQVRVQDELGQYHFAHAGGPNARSETKTADGITRGEYSYVDGNGLLQSAAYIADSVNGFRVAATNLPAGPAVPSGPALVAAAQPAVIAQQAVLAAPAEIVSGPAIVGPVAGGVIVQGPVEGEPQVVPAEASAADASPAPAPESSEPSTAAPEAAPAPESGSEGSAAVEAAPAPAPAPVNPFVPVEDTPEVIAARAQHLAAVQEAQARDQATGTEASTEPTETPETPEPSEAPSSTPAPAPEAPSTPAPAEPAVIPSAISTVQIAGPLPSVPLAALSPVAAVAAPAVARVASIAAPSVSPVAAPVAAIGIAPALAPIAFADAAQYRVQDELGQYAFEHIGGPNARQEISTADGITRGGYSYVDGNGLIQSAAYVSDPVNGFRVAATNLPVQPAPSYIPDSPEVAEAKAALFRAQAEHIAKL